MSALKPQGRKLLFGLGWPERLCRKEVCLSWLVEGTTRGARASYPLLSTVEWGRGSGWSQLFMLPWAPVNGCGYRESLGLRRLDGNPGWSPESSEVTQWLNRPNDQPIFAHTCKYDPLASRNSQLKSKSQGSGPPDHQEFLLAFRKINLFWLRCMYVCLHEFVYTTSMRMLMEARRGSWILLVLSYRQVWAPWNRNQVYGSKYP